MKNLKITMVPVVQFRTEYICSSTGKVKGWNHKYQKPGVAAEEWARCMASIWEEKMFRHRGDGAIYHHMTDADYKAVDAYRQKCYRRVLPVFKRLLATK